MPTTAVIEHGSEPNYHLNPDAETGLLVKSIQFTPERETTLKKGHTATARRAVVHVRSENPTLAIQVEAEIVADTNGDATGLAEAHPGDAAALAHFASGASIHGFTRDTDRLLLIESASRTINDGEDPPSVTIGLRYFPFVDIAA